MEPSFYKTAATASPRHALASEALPSAPNTTAEPAPGYGLRREALSPLETLGQSISGVCPTLTPYVTAPLVFTLAGNGTWLAYVFATIGILLVGWCIGRFARYSASPGSLYSYAAMILPPWLATIAAWSLLLAYVMGSASNIGGFYYFGNAMLHDATGHIIPTVILAVIIGVAPVWIAWSGVKVSARMMLGLEAISVTFIIIVLALVLWRRGLHVDLNQMHLRGVTPGGFRQGLVLAIYSFVGFESATALGSEARNPLRAIPRAVMQTAILSGFFFTICAYTEVLGMGMAGKDLATTDVPMHVLATVGGVPYLGLLIDIGALVSLFAGIIACISAAARVLLQMAHNGLAHRSLTSTHVNNDTPTGALIATGLGAFLPVLVLAVKGTSGLDVYGWLGTLAVYGFVVTYGLVCFALPRYLRDHHGVVNLATRSLPFIACAAMLFALIANLYPIPEGAYGKLPYIYLAYLGVVLMAFRLRSRGATAKEVM